ncbi:hypothetical protein PINS_up018630 [Pythium insidiosum]|nr:hypothetical protein PINS_up016266 [Pythium insidiosum]GLE07888.1 hypothetical protein PINS_up018630 [Pythium insidiosum]
MSARRERERDPHDLSDVEWRQMRRQLPCLQFDPVPETPPLLPRSLYAEPTEPTEHGPVANSTVTASASPEHTPSPATRAPSLHVHFADDPNPRASPVAAGAPLSISELALPDATASGRSAARVEDALLAETKPLSTSTLRVSAAAVPSPTHAGGGGATVILHEPAVASLPPSTVELDELASAIDAAHEETKRSILAAVAAATDKTQRDAELERRKLEAAHTNRVAMLETRIQELEATAVEREQRETHADAVVERLSMLVGHWKRRQVHIATHKERESV